MIKKKQSRLHAIKDLIAHHEIEDQDQLVDMLKKRFSIDVNQSMISRDLRVLGAVKRKRRDKFVYELESLNITSEILHNAIVTIVYNESMVVIHTVEGLAAFVGDYIDQLESEKILATLAGENTVLVIPVTTKNIQDTFKHVCALIHYRES